MLKRVQHDKIGRKFKNPNWTKTDFSCTFLHTFALTLHKIAPFLQLKNCWVSPNLPTVNKNKHWGLINLEVVSHIDSNKRNLATEWIRCAIWREDEDLGTFFDIVLKKFGKNKKREHYTDMRKICTQILDECKKFADGNSDSRLYDAKNFLRDLFNAKGRRCE